MSRTPEEIVKDLAPAYHEWKGGEKDKEKLKTEFFDAITEYLKLDGEQADRLVTVEADRADTACKVAEKLYPAWVAVDQRQPDDGRWEVIMEERAEYQSFTTELDGEVWTRQVVEGSQMLDNEALEAEDPELWKRVAHYPYETLLNDSSSEANVPQTEIHNET